MQKVMTTRPLVTEIFSDYRRLEFVETINLNSMNEHFFAWWLRKYFNWCFRKVFKFFYNAAYHFKNLICCESHFIHHELKVSKCIIKCPWSNYPKITGLYILFLIISLGTISNKALKQTIKSQGEVLIVVIVTLLKSKFEPSSRPKI